MPSKTNKREALVKQEAEKLGWEVLAKGWPDYLFWDKTTKTAIAIEVKSAKDPLKKHQRKVHKVLRRAGLRVKTIQVNKQMINCEKGRLELVKRLRDLLI